MLDIRKILFNIGIILIAGFFNTNFIYSNTKNAGKYAGNNIIILCFHDIDGAGKYSITTQEFVDILALLKNRFEVYSLKDWHTRVDSGQLFKKPPIVLTFDDGYTSIFNIVIPELKKRRFGGTFFVYLEKYDDDTWPFKALSSLPEQFEVGSHSFTHADMVDLYVNNRKVFYKEIFLSKKKLEFLLGKPVVSWAWPYGYYNKDMENMPKKAGYTIQVNTSYKTTANEFGTSSFSRFTVQNPDPVDQVKEILKKNSFY